MEFSWKSTLYIVYNLMTPLAVFFSMYCCCMVLQNSKKVLIKWQAIRLREWNCIEELCTVPCTCEYIYFFHFTNFILKFRYSEKATKFEKILSLKIWSYWVASDFKWKIFQILWPSQNIQTFEFALHCNF